MTSFHSQNFGIDDIQSMMRNHYIDRLSRPGNTNKIVRRGAEMATTRKPRKVRFYNCREFGHFQRDCTNPKRERSTTSKWCSLHNSTAHSDAECKAQKGREDANTLLQDEVTNTPPQALAQKDGTRQLSKLKDPPRRQRQRHQLQQQHVSL